MNVITAQTLSHVVSHKNALKRYDTLDNIMAVETCKIFDEEIKLCIIYITMLLQIFYIICFCLKFITENVRMLRYFDKYLGNQAYVCKI